MYLWDKPSIRCSVSAGKAVQVIAGYARALCVVTAVSIQVVVAES